MSHPDVAKIDRAAAEHDLRELAEELGYTTAILTDGTVVCEPPVDPDCCQTCEAAAAPKYTGGDQCADCGAKLTALDRHQVVINGPGLSFGIRFVCPEHYRARTS